jgi:signal transduction histidine kinase
VALTWAAAASLAVLAARWRLSWRTSSGWFAGAVWSAPAAALPLVAPAWLPASPAAIAAIPAGLVLFALVATALRQRFHTASEGSRLLLQLAAFVAPVFVAYPLAAASINQSIRTTIERDYAPAAAAAQQPAALMEVLTTAQAELDAIPDLAAIVGNAASRPGTVASQAAFSVWRQTVLSRGRVTSELELFGPDRRVTSRFSLNFPEFSLLAPDTDQTWSGEGCGWDAFAEVARFGSGERSLLHAERGVCSPDGRVLGAIVLHIVPDYQALSFVASANPYYDALAIDAPRPDGPRAPDVQVVVYGWSLQPVFASGRVVWPIDPGLDDRLYASREPFWVRRQSEGRWYHVHFSNDRGGVYAIGYRVPTPLQHATRLAEATATLALAFVLFLACTLVAAPLLRPSTPALVRVFREVRASFYRKLFLFFVLAAVGPVLLFAVAFGSYMTGKLRADVEAEAGSVATVARRVFDEIGALQGPRGQSPVPSDEVMVWIRQVVGQDVHLFDGPLLRATSQRDLFDSGLLPARTPASVYREVVLERRPVSVVEDDIAGFTYLVASAPVPTVGREAVLSVPLAHRQREIERQVDELSRGVLAGTLVVVLFAAALGASVAGKVSDPVARLTRATRHIAAGRLDEHLVADTADELGRLVDDFNTMTETLAAQRAELARVHQVKAWAEMARQVAHDIKNPLTPIQLAAEHLQRVHDDRGRPMGPVFDQCLVTILQQVRLLRRIASEFSTFAGEPSPRFEAVAVASLVAGVVEPYQLSLPSGTRIDLHVSGGLPQVRVDRTLLSRALTNLVENALQAMPDGGVLRVSASADADFVRVELRDSGVGMDAEGVRRAFEPYFSTKTAGSGLGLANAKRNVETCGGTLTLASEPGAGTVVTMTMPVARPDGSATG